MPAVDHDIDVQAVVAEQDRGRGFRVSGAARQLRWAAQPGRRPLVLVHDQLAALHRIPGGVQVRPADEGANVVQEAAAPVDDPAAPVGVVGSGRGAVTEGVRAVQGVVEGNPPGVGGVDGEPGVHHRDHQLGAGHRGYLFVDAAVSTAKSSPSGSR